MCNRSTSQQWCHAFGCDILWVHCSFPLTTGPLKGHLGAGTLPFPFPFVLAFFVSPTPCITDS